jgi:hypothetical protein
MYFTDIRMESNCSARGEATPFNLLFYTRRINGNSDFDWTILRLRRLSNPSNSDARDSVYGFPDFVRRVACLAAHSTQL